MLCCVVVWLCVVWCVVWSGKSWVGEQEGKFITQKWRHLGAARVSGSGSTFLGE